MCVTICKGLKKFYSRSSTILERFCPIVSLDMRNLCEKQGYPFHFNEKVTQWTQTVSLINAYCLAGSQMTQIKDVVTLVDSWIYNAKSYIELPVYPKTDEKTTQEQMKINAKMYMQSLFENSIKAGGVGFFVLPCMIVNSLILKTTRALQLYYDLNQEETESLQKQINKYYLEESTLKNKLRFCFC